MAEGEERALTEDTGSQDGKEDCRDDRKRLNGSTVFNLGVAGFLTVFLVVKCSNNPCFVCLLGPRYTAQSEGKGLLYSTSLNIQNKVYYLDVKETRNGARLLKMTEVCGIFFHVNLVILVKIPRSC